MIDAGQPTVVELALRISRRELLRCLGYPRSRQPASLVAARIEALEEIAASLVEARGGYRIVPGAEAIPSGMPEPGEVVGLGLCTIGPGLEEESRRLGEAGEALDSLILDAHGSAAAEAAADALDRVLCAAAAGLGLIPARRISPGYGRWALDGQRALIALLPARELGVTLSDGSMMTPRKSVSFAARLVVAAAGAGASVAPRRRRCQACTLDPCPYRIAGETDLEEEDDE
jgi:hypothetical protein